jgi:hypothetical protein
VQAARAAGRQRPAAAGGQRPGPGGYRWPASLDPGGQLFAWLRRIGALPPHFGGVQQIMRKEALQVAAHRPASPAHRSFELLLRTGLPTTHPLAGQWRTACQKRQLRQWLTYHAHRGTDVLTWLQQLAALTPPSQ